MKLKKMLSALLAAVMVFALTCTPAFAAIPATPRQILDNGDVWFDVKEIKSLQTTISVSEQWWTAEKSASTGYNVRTKQAPLKPSNFNVIELPLGVTLTAGPNCPHIGNIFVYSDPDGDGVYELRVEKATYTESGWETERDCVKTLCGRKILW